MGSSIAPARSDIGPAAPSRTGPAALSHTEPAAPRTHQPRRRFSPRHWSRHSRVGSSSGSGVS